jgi:hypothetical protein
MRTDGHDVTLADLHALVAGGDGADLEQIPGTTSMRSVGVTPTTRAARFGASNGDTIDSINDEPLSSVAAAYRAAASAMRTQEIVIKGHRGNEPYTTVLRVRGA